MRGLIAFVMPIISSTGTTTLIHASRLRNQPYRRPPMWLRRSSEHFMPSDFSAAATPHSETGCHPQALSRHRSQQHGQGCALGAMVVWWLLSKSDHVTIFSARVTLVASEASCEHGKSEQADLEADKISCRVLGYLVCVTSQQSRIPCRVQSIGRMVELRFARVPSVRHPRDAYETAGTCVLVSLFLRPVRRRALVKARIRLCSLYHSILTSLGPKQHSRPDSLP